MESILLGIKDSLGIESESDVYDQELIMHLNSIFMSLHQIGAGPDPALEITGPAETWSLFFENYSDMGAVKTIVLQKVRLMFDPPTSSYLIGLMEKNIEQLEWRIQQVVENRTLTAIVEGSPFDSGFDSGFGG